MVAKLDNFRLKPLGEELTLVKCAKDMEIIDIECVLLSFLSKKFVATKWPIYKGILARPNLLWQGISRGCGE